MDTRPPQGPFYIVVNPKSGDREADRQRRQIADAMTAAKRACVFIPSAGSLAQAAAAAVSQARRDNGVVVAVGGDGTLNSVCQAVLGSGVSLGVIPTGTFNYFARSLGIPEETSDAAFSLCNARHQTVQLGLVNERVFLVNASLGIYPKLLEDREAFKSRYGRSRWVALLAALATLSRAHQRLQISLRSDAMTTQLHTASLVVNNNPLQLSQVGIGDADALEERKLVAILARPQSRLSLYRLLLQGMLSRLGEAEHIDSFKVREMVVNLGRRRRVKVATDGEVAWMRSPLTFRVAEQKLTVLVPQHPDAVAP